MSKKKLVDANVRLAESAFDFLEKSVDEIEKHPKYAVIHFATAVELLLKARLVLEHWTLVVERASEASLEDFRAGKCKTVSQADAIKRLINVCGENITKDAITQFEKIAAHRNRMIHFFHEAGVKQADKKLVQEVVTEQCICWFYLERLLFNWSDQFKGFEQNILRFRWRMRRNREYLSVVFEQLKPKIDADKRAGIIFQACSGCGYEAAAVDELSKVLFEKHCRVCGLGEAYLEISCPSGCGAILHIEADSVSDRECRQCKHHVKAEELAEILDTEGFEPTDYNTSMNCAECVTLGSVVQHNELYVCTECLTTSDTIAGCAWCNELQMGGGDLEWSYQTGCEFCDGHAGWTKDD